jgi:hypothetical protein
MNILSPTQTGHVMNKQSTARTLSTDELSANRQHSQLGGSGFFSTLTHMVLKQKRQRLALAK